MERYSQSIGRDGSARGENEHPRQAVRDSLLLAAPFYVDGVDVGTVRVRNLSAGGMMIEFAKPLAIGTPVATELRGIGWIEGRVAWYTDGRAGIAFDVNIDPMAARKPVGKGAHTPVFVKPILPLF